MKHLHGPQIANDITMETKPRWSHRKYRGTADALIEAGIAKPFMFAEPPKRVLRGWFKGDLFSFEWKGQDDEWRGFRSKRLKGGTFELVLDKTIEEYEATKNNFDDVELYERLRLEAQALVYRATLIARGELDGNVKDFHLANHEEIHEAAGRLISLLIEGRLVETRNHALRVLPGGESKKGFILEAERNDADIH